MTRYLDILPSVSKYHLHRFNISIPLPWLFAIEPTCCQVPFKLSHIQWQSCQNMVFRKPDLDGSW